MSEKVGECKCRMTGVPVTLKTTDSVQPLQLADAFVTEGALDKPRRQDQEP
jgi:hypothetical protein